MSKCNYIIPDGISSNTFDFYGASIEVDVDSIYPLYEPYMFFRNDGKFTSTANTPPPLYKN